ncbi:helix-turn-helix transcriptional regulator [Herbiconiux daphne]|uniref:Helix-turn-helix domain-containing protein n=1 Tax=Herbiconiux daphne TaxID=2970914 RepID=A0ABT2GXZ7_9MICO|nr:helix-turn-helix domain-containing protein [Herbiconiux daphne]MCS5732834.1 helix-turn-helix domain-containing protein [Herbiconiux daphne]
MTHRDPAPQIVRVTGLGGTPPITPPDVWIEVIGTTIRLVPMSQSPATPGGTGDADGTLVEIELLWLTGAESAVIEQGAIDGSAGLGGAIAALVLGMPRAAGAPHALLRRQIAVTVRGVVSAVASERVEAGTASATPQQQLVVRAMQLVNSGLDDPLLTSRTIADRLGVSLRTLQVAFRDSGPSPSALIWALRLERAQLEVAASAEPLTRPEAVAVGTRWGFRGAAHFTRAYERRYGVRLGRSSD